MSLWQDWEVDRLRAMLAEGRTHAEIARALDRTERSVGNKANKLARGGDKDLRRRQGQSASVAKMVERLRRLGWTCTPPDDTLPPGGVVFL